MSVPVTPSWSPVTSTWCAPAVAALYVQGDSCYFDLVGVDCWDAVRDARLYAGPAPVVAHPPCRGWGRLRHLAKPRFDEKQLAFFALASVRAFGGVLEHPFGSSFWPEANLPLPGAGCDAYGGWSMLVRQGWWGHPAPKPTLLYVVGIARSTVELPSAFVAACGSTASLCANHREKTPVEFARWLVSLASRCDPSFRGGSAVARRSAVDKRAALRAHSLCL